jgi:hypothetical protein
VNLTIFKYRPTPIFWKTDRLFNPVVMEDPNLFFLFVHQPFFSPDTFTTKPGRPPPRPSPPAPRRRPPGGEASGDGHDGWRAEAAHAAGPRGGGEEAGRPAPRLRLRARVPHVP